MTVLYNVVGDGLTLLIAQASRLQEHEQPNRSMVVSDEMDNASRRFWQQDVRDLVERGRKLN